RPFEVEPSTREAVEELLLDAVPADLALVSGPDTVDARIDRHAVDEHLAGCRRLLEPLQPGRGRPKVEGDPTRVARVARGVVASRHGLAHDRGLDQHEVTVDALQRDG